MKFKEVCIKLWNFLKLLSEDYRSLPAVLAAGSLANALLPYISLFYSARILDRITAGQLSECVPDILTMLILMLIIGLGSRSCDQRLAVIRRSCASVTEEKAAQKAFRMEYEEMEKGEVLDSFRQIRSGVNGNGGIDSQVDSMYKIMQSLWGGLFAFIFIIVMFSQTGEGRGDFWISVVSPVLLVGLYGLLFWICLRLSAISKRKNYEMRRENEKTNGKWTYLMQYIFMDYQAGKDIRLYSMQPMIREIYENMLMKILPVYLKWGQNDGLYTGVIVMATQIAAAFCYFFVGLKAIYGIISIGSVLMYAGAINRFIEVCRSAITEYNELAYRMEYLQIYDQFLKRPNMHYDGTLPIEKRNDGRYELEFQDISFHYPGSDTMVLDHLNLKFTIGEKFALVGRNGAGKTTLIKLLCRLYEPTSGKILLNGIDIGLYDYDEYVRIFSVVFQDFKIFAFPLDQNVACSDEVDEEKLRRALDRAGVAPWVHTLPDTAHTQLYKNNGDGVEISGGEAQKLAIARALYKDAPFIILDEPTAALDPLAEAEIYEQFNQMIQGKTAIYISHRMSSCKFCGDILVLDHGRLVERGSHEELLRLGGIYASLYNTQAQYYQS